MIICELKAGRLKREGTKLVPDPRRGLVRLEKDLVIPPGDADILSVPECASGTAFVLKFNNSAVRLYFWLQEPDPTVFDVKSLNDALAGKHFSATRTAPTSRAAKASLKDVFSDDNIGTCLESSSDLASFVSLLPESAPKTKEELYLCLKSPQFAQAISFLDEAIDSGHLGSLLSQFGLPSDDNAAGIRAFLEAIVRKAKQPD